MIAHESIRMFIDEKFRAGQEATKSKEEIYSFYPRRKNDTAFIIELKKDEVPEVAIYQIKEKEYAQKMLKEYERILAVAICYDSKKKVHQCKIEEICG